MGYNEFRNPNLKDNNESDRKSKTEDWEFHMPRTDQGFIDVKWNHKCVRFPEAILKAVKDGHLDPTLEHEATDIVIFQLDTGYSDHPSLIDYKGYDTKLSKTFINNDEGKGKDDFSTGPQDPAHGTRTAFTVVGTKGKDEQYSIENHISKKITKAPDTIVTTPFNQGLFPHVKFIPVRISNNVVLGFKSVDSMLEGVKYAINNKAHIITMSMGGKGGLLDSGYNKAADLAYQAGVIFTCAAGQPIPALSGVVQPAKNRKTIAVAGIQSVNNSGKENPEIRYIPLIGGHKGKRIDISAPAKWVVAAGIDPNNGSYHVFGTGTSQATSHVAAAAALWRHYWKDELEKGIYVENKTHIIEAFRYALNKSKYVPNYWKDKPNYERINKGILNVEKLLDIKLEDYENEKLNN